MELFRNYYRCERCGHEWTDEWSAQCDDCPKCGARHMSPYKSDDVEDDDE
jgi:predicted  nucleic acid-binding Zn-ribbon protein